METTNVNGVPVVILAQPLTESAAMHPYSSQRQDLLKKMSILGSLQIVFGSLCVIFQISTMVLSGRYWLHGVTFIGYGIWTGVIFIVTGSFGCAAGKLSNKSFMITFNVMSIISASIIVFLFTFSIMSAVVQSYFGASRYYYHDDDVRDSELRKAHMASIALESLMSILAVAETVVAILSSVVCCKIGACCCDCGDSCCCPPAPVPTRILLTQQNIDGQLQQTVVMYTANTPQQPVANTFQDSKNQPEFPYQQLMADPNAHSDFEAADHTRLCV